MFGFDVIRLRLRSSWQIVTSDLAAMVSSWKVGLKLRMSLANCQPQGVKSNILQVRGLVEIPWDIQIECQCWSHQVTLCSLIGLQEIGCHDGTIALKRAAVRFRFGSAMTVPLRPGWLPWHRSACGRPRCLWRLGVQIVLRDKHHKCWCHSKFCPFSTLCLTRFSLLVRSCKAFLSVSSLSLFFEQPGFTLCDVVTTSSNSMKRFSGQVKLNEVLCIPFCPPKFMLPDEHPEIWSLPTSATGLNVTACRSAMCRAKNVVVSGGLLRLLSEQDENDKTRCTQLAGEAWKHSNCIEFVLACCGYNGLRYIISFKKITFQPHRPSWTFSGLRLFWQYLQWDLPGLLYLSYGPCFYLRKTHAISVQVRGSIPDQFV